MPETDAIVAVEPLWTPEQMAAALGPGFTVWTVRRLYSTGELQGKIIRHKLRFTRESYDQFVAGVTEMKTPFGRKRK